MSHARKSLEIYQRTGILGQFNKEVLIYDDNFIVINFYDGSSLNVKAHTGLKVIIDSPELIQTLKQEQEQEQKPKK